MLTTKTASSSSLPSSSSSSSSCPATPSDLRSGHRHHHQQQQLQQQLQLQHQQQGQVKELFETWPVKGRRVFAVETQVRPEVGCCCSCVCRAGAGGSGGGAGVTTSGRRASRLQQPMSNVCPYPLQGHLAAATASTQSNSSSSTSGTGGSGVPSVVAVAVVVGGVAAAATTRREEPDRRSPSIDDDIDNDVDVVAAPMDETYSLDLERIAGTVSRLDASGWYYGQLSWKQATSLLKSQPVGTFLVRDSSDPMFLFALSVQTERGPTSVRIHYGDGQFKLDAETTLFGAMPLFDCVVQLVDYYVQLVGRSAVDKSKAHVWLDESGRRDIPVRLSRPLYCRVPLLQHLARVTINRTVNSAAEYEAEKAVAAAAAAAAAATAATGAAQWHQLRRRYFPLVRTPLQRLASTDALPTSLLSFIAEYPFER